MARNVTPTQEHYNDAYRNISFPSLVNDYQVFASKTFSNLLKSFGDDIVLDGFDISNIANTPTDVSLTVGTGWAILDSVLAKITTVSDLVYVDANLLSADGRFIAYLSYEYFQQTRPDINELTVQLSYVSSAGVVTPGWNSGRDRIIVDIFEFTLDSENLIDSFTRSSDWYITIGGTDYNKLGIGNDNIAKLINNCGDFIIQPDSLRDGNCESITYNFEDYITSVLYSTILGDFRLDFTYNADWIVTVVESYFRDVLVLTTNYTYDWHDNIISWVES
jgi:hypothetical protein